MGKCRVVNRSEGAPFSRIAAELRRRIAEGELATGQRVPSMRQVAREFGVALATAAKALDLIRHEGLIVTRPRSGSVVAAPHSLRAPHRSVVRELDRAQVLSHAINVADAAGLPAVSMRAVAGRCGVSPMSLYRYLDSKDELILAMADTAYGAIALPDKENESWRDRVEELAGSLWRIHQQHPWLAQLHPLTRPLPVPSLLVIGDQILGALSETTLPPKVRFDVYVLLYSHIAGLSANFESEDVAASNTGVSYEEWADLQYQPTMRSEEALARYPNLVGMFGALGELEDGYDLDLDQLFHLGLRLLLDGVEALSSTYPNRVL